MTSIMLKFRPSKADGSPGMLYYQLIHRQNVRRISAGLRIFPDEWDECQHAVIVPPDGPRQSEVRNIRETIRKDIERMARLVRDYEESGLEYSADDIVTRYRQYGQDYSLGNMIRGIASELENEGKTRTADNYRSAWRSFMRFRSNRDLMPDALETRVVEAYQSWLRNSGVSPNTSSFYLRILRAVYNRAVEMGVTTDNRPFGRVYTGNEKTMKRAIALTMIRKIKRMDLSGTPGMDFARDMFMMSFYLRGMSFIDMAYLRKSDLNRGYIYYRRHKTGQALRIAWTGEMRQLVEKYGTEESEYLLPILSASGGKYALALRHVNYHLKKLGRILDIDIPLTMYVARHSWASAARSKGIPVHVISEGMGHDSEHTTRIYLASLYTATVDRANSRILRAL